MNSLDSKVVYKSRPAIQKAKFICYNQTQQINQSINSSIN